MDDADHTYYLESDRSVPFSYHYTDGQAKQNILSKTFDISVPSDIYIEMGINFAVGDLAATLVQTSNNHTVYCKHTSNAAFLFALLEVGTYNLSITTGDVQSLQANEAVTSNFPNCVLFTLKFVIIPRGNVKGCFDYVMLPDTLRNAPFLTSSNWVKIQAKFQQPDGEHSMDLRVVVDSFLKIRISEYDYTMAVFLYENTNIIPSYYNTPISQQLEYSLIANRNYQITVFSTSPQNFVCHSFFFELEIIPSNDVQNNNNNNQVCSQLDAPDASLFEFTELPYVVQQNFKIMSEQLVVPFTLNETTYFYFALSQDFVPGNVTMLVRNPALLGGTGVPYGVTVTLSTVYGYLNAGTYHFIINRVSNPLYTLPNTCIEYALTIAFSPSVLPVQESIADCLEEELPGTLNTIAYLSPFSGNMTHFHDDILLLHTTQITSFTIEEQSLLRIFVGGYPSITISVFLYDEIHQHYIGTSHQAPDLTDFFTESLGPGDYSLQLRFSGITDQLQRCSSFPFELQLMSMSYLESLPSLNHNCTTVEPPNAITNGIYLNSNYQFTHNYQNSPYSKTINIEITNSPQAVYIELQYNFATGGLNLRLSYRNSNEINRVYYIYPTYSQNTAFIDTVLTPEYQYQLEIIDSTVFNLYENYCISYGLFITIGNPVNPDCAISETLPTDLYTSAGGSYQLGGPQNNQTGAFKIVGRFPVEAQGTTRSILFQVPTVTSALRVFIGGDNLNLRVTLYDSNSLPIQTLEGNSLWKILPSSRDFRLFLEFISVPPNLYCQFFTFQMELEPVTAVQEKLLCPAIPLNPATPDTIYELNDNFWVYGEYSFNSTSLTYYRNSNYSYYRILLTPNVPGTLYTVIKSDFISGSFTFNLINALHSNSVLLRSHSEPTVNIDDVYDFRSSIEYELQAGHYYYLDIVVLMNRNPFNMTNYCLPFEFTFSFATLPNNYLQFIDPPYGVSVSPFYDYVISFLFSDPIVYPTAASSLSSFQFALLLPTTITNSIIFPTSISYHDNNKRIVLVFDHSQFVWGESYSLRYDLSLLESQEGVYVDPFTEIDHLYTFQSCNCNLRGTCTVDEENRRFVCQCEEGYAGQSCELCAVGYHQANYECLRDSYCTATTCNGHGACTNVNGEVSCHCDVGYATFQDQWCSVCSPGYVLIPSNLTCIVEPDGFDRSTFCDVPFLPSNLNTINFLDYDSHVHLFDDFFLDIDKSEHNITFTIDNDSLFRVFIENQDNLQIGCRLLISNSQQTSVISCIHSLTGVTLYTELIPGDYEMMIDYTVLHPHSATECNTISLELEVETINNINEYYHLCDLVSTSVEVPENNNQTINIPEGVGYNYTSTAPFTIHSSSPNNVFYQVKLHVPQSSISDLQSKRILITIDVGYNFLTGQVGILLEKYTDSQCQIEGNCIFGKRYYNSQRLSAYLTGNADYTIYLYQPLPPYAFISDCIQYTFSYSVQYVENEETQWNCDAERLPYDITDYVDSNGYLHVAAEYFLPKTSFLLIHIAERSIFRIAVGGKPVALYYRVASADGWNDYSYNPYFTSLSAILEENTYEIRIDTWSSSVLSDYSNSDFCQTTPIEIGIEPYPNNTQVLTCSSPTEVLPYVIPELITVPYTFGIPTESVPPMVYTYTCNSVSCMSSFNNMTIYSFTFQLNSTAQIDIGVASDFIHHNLMVVIEEVEIVQFGSDNIYSTSYGQSYYNYNFINKILSPATYRISIKTNKNFVETNCVSFNFQFELSEVMECITRGEPIPTTLNSLRFLGSRDNQFENINYISKHFKIPPRFQVERSASTQLSLYAPENLLFRLSFDANQNINIGCELSKWVNGDYMIVAHSLSDNQPSALLYQLESGSYYTLRIFFYESDNSILSSTICPTFTMHFAIASIEPLQPSICPSQGGSHWYPPLPSELPEPAYHYDNKITRESLYFQQIGDSRRYHSNTFYLLSNANLYVEVNFDFHNVQLQIQLVNLDSNGIIYATSNWNSAVLKRVNLPIGNYQLQIFELVTTPPSVIGCAYFNYKILIEPYSFDAISQLSAQQLYPTFPDSFNTISYLSLTSTFHFIEVYKFRSVSNMILFTLQEDSFIRVKVINEHNYIVNIDLQKDGEIIVLTAEENVAATLLSGTSVYSLFLLVSDLNSEYTVEVTIYPSSREIANQNSEDELQGDCPTSLWPTPRIEGNYYYHSSEMTVHPTSDPVLAGTTQFELTTESWVLVQIDYQFLPSEYSLFLHNVENSIRIEAKARLNQREIYTLLPVGHYIVTLQLESPGTLPDHCNVYRLLFIISLTGDYRECINFLTLPYDLINADGGSTVFGGPIQNNQLNFVGPNFLYSTESYHTSSILFQLNEASMITVYSSSHTGTRDPLNFVIQKDSTFAEPVMIFYDSSQIKSETYFLDVSHTGGSNEFFDLVLFDGKPQGSTIDCPSYSLFLNIDSKANLPSICTSLTEVNQLPLTQLTQLNSGYISDWVSADISSVMLNTVITSNLIVTQNSILEISVSYNSLMMYSLLTIKNSDNLIISTGSIAPDTLYSPSNRNDRTNMRIYVKSALPSGNYVIQWTPRPLNGETNDYECFPYTWYFQLTPVSTTPFVSFVYPPNLSVFNSTSNDLVIDLTFSAIIFSNMVKVDNQNKSPLQSALYLEASNASNPSLSPSFLLNTDYTGINWRIKFSSAALVPGESYLLKLHPHILTDLNSLSFTKYSSNQYNISRHCPTYSVYILTTNQCQCLTGYSGPNCDTCSPGYSGYPNCVSDTYCNPSCVHGQCIQRQCVCDIGWTGDGCTYCDSHFQGETCSECVKGWAGDQCDQCAPNYLPPNCQDCVDHFTGTDCTECVIGWTGSSCSTCAPHFTGSNCDQCTTGWTGPRCDQCAPHFTGTACNQCISHFTGTNCDMCITGFTGPNCDVCQTGFTGPYCAACDTHFTGTNCDQCITGWTGAHCDQCAPHFTGSNCDQCMEPFTGPNCDQCSGHFSGPECNQCALGWAGTDCDHCDTHFNGTDCNQCVHGFANPLNYCNDCAPHFLAPNCTTCEYPFTGENCTECSGHFAGSDCSFCENGWASPDTGCASCAEHFTGHNCESCENGWAGPTCAICAENFVGSNCEDCENNWQGERCDFCPPNYLSSDCLTCAPGYSGDDCLADEVSPGTVVNDYKGLIFRELGFLCVILLFLFGCFFLVLVVAIKLRKVFSFIFFLKNYR